MLGAGALGRPRGMVWGGRRERGSRWGTHIYLWWIHVDVWKNQYNIKVINLQFKINKFILKMKINEILKYLNLHKEDLNSSNIEFILHLGSGYLCKIYIYKLIFSLYQSKLLFIN